MKYPICEIPISSVPLKSGNASKLYYKGDISLLEKEIIAVIGKRDTTPRYNEIARRIGISLSDEFVVLNGLARGVDKSVMEGVVEQHGKAIVVLPCGIDLIYPSSCKKLAQDILDNGGLIISQYESGIAPEKFRFIERDKMQVQLASKIIVVDSLKQGGTMHTVKFALKNAKQIGCVTGVDTPEGNQYIIEKYNAEKLTCKEDVILFARKKEKQYQQIQFSFV